jgi:hypothetical protein
VRERHRDKDTGKDTHTHTHTHNERERRGSRERQRHIYDADDVSVPANDVVIADNFAFVYGFVALYAYNATVLYVAIFFLSTVLLPLLHLLVLPIPLLLLLLLLCHYG